MIDALPLPAALDAPTGTVTLRRAAEADLDDLVRLLSDDPVSAGRGDRAQAQDLPAYRAALREVQQSPGNDVVVAIGADGSVVATFQLTVIPGMARRGARRMQVEAVRVASLHRSGGVGGAMMRWVADVAAPATGCTLVQLTSDRARGAAHRFYERLGYAASHVGFKLGVPTPR